MPIPNKVPTYKKSYPWALNPIKLNEAIADLETMKANDPSVEINEAEIKFRYIIRKGAVLKSEEDLAEEAKAARAKKIADARTLIAETEAEEETEEKLAVGRKPNAKKEKKEEEAEEGKDE